MEKSIKRVEKLVHVTNSALAQMKFSLMFDDLDGGGKFRDAKGFEPVFGESFLDGDDLRRCQSEFKSEASEMLGKMESICGSNELSRRNSKAVDRIKEINRKMNHIRLEQSKREETEQSRQKLLNLISEEKFSPGVASSKDSVRSRRVGHLSRERKPAEKPAPKKTDSPLVVVAKSPDKSAEELKSKILETQEIVNRGFHTARRLAQKVDTMAKGERKEKTPSTEKTVSEIDWRSPEGRTESNDTASTVKCRRCAKRKRRKSEEKVEQASNIRVIEIKRKEVEGYARSKLQVQRLPSVHIKGRLQMQKIHSLEIPAGGDASCAKTNTAINFLSHEQMESEKMGELIEKVRRENCCCTGGDTRGNYVECFNCGKLIRVRETRVDPRKVDEILQKCNFDVFDPRIDEFVEKCATGTAVNWCDGDDQPPDVAPPPDPVAAEPEATPKEVAPKPRVEHPKKARSTLQSLSEKLLKKYRQEADTIESNHLELENILQNLFRRVDESREVFERCSFLKNKNPDSGTGPKLTATKPVLVSLTGTSFGTGRKPRKLYKVRDGNKNRAESGKTEGEENVPCRIKSAETEKTEGRVSVIYCNRNGKSEERGIPSASSGGKRGSPKLSEIGKVGGASSSVTSSSTSNSWSCGPAVNVPEKANAEETPSVRHGNAKSDRVFEKEETQRKSLGASNKSKTEKVPETRKEELEVEKAPSETLSSSSSESRRAVQTDGDKTRVSEAMLGGIGMERKTVTSPMKSEGKAPSETSSEKSENNYESDFESMTNEPNEVVDECEDEEPEMNLCVNKLSTISEVDSELERKLSDEQRTLRSSRNAELDDAAKSETAPRDAEKPEGDVDLPVQKEGSSTAVEVSTESKKTEATSPRTTKSTPTELVTSLKDILSALQDQFVRTESLAEKLTENARPEILVGDLASSSWRKSRDERLVENLRSARKDLVKSQRRAVPPPREKEQGVSSADGLSDEGGSSLGEIVRSDRRRKTPEKSSSSSISEWIASDGREANPGSVFKLDVNSEEVLYSEGEIPSDELLHRFRTDSVGEVRSGKDSIASSVDDN